MKACALGSLSCSPYPRVRLSDTANLRDINNSVLHTGQAFYTRRYWMLATAVCCGLGEVIGWTGRLWSSLNVLDNTPFLMQ